MSAILSSKSQGHPFICGLLVAQNATVVPTHSAGAFQTFYDSSLVENDFTPIYNSVGKVSFTEQGQKTKSGHLFTQELVFRLPNGDTQRSIRLAQLLQSRFFAIALTTGKFLLMGRNDITQNASPVITSRSLPSTTEITVSTTTIHSTGYLYIEGSPAFPFVIPANT